MFRVHVSLYAFRRLRRKTQHKKICTAASMHPSMPQLLPTRCKVPMNLLASQRQLRANVFALSCDFWRVFHDLPVYMHSYMAHMGFWADLSCVSSASTKHHTVTWCGSEWVLKESTPQRNSDDSTHHALSLSWSHSHSL